VRILSVSQAIDAQIAASPSNRTTLQSCHREVQKCPCSHANPGFANHEVVHPFHHNDIDFRNDMANLLGQRNHTLGSATQCLTNDLAAPNWFPWSVQPHRIFSKVTGQLICIGPYACLDEPADELDILSAVHSICFQASQRDPCFVGRRAVSTRVQEERWGWIIAAGAATQ